MPTIVTLIALLIALSSGSRGINPVQHSEGATTQNASKGINPVQHSE